MTKRILSKYSICKKLRNPYNNLWGIKNKNFCKAVLSKKRKKRLTSYGKLLNIKQSFKFFYSNISEKSFKQSVKSCIKSPSNTIDKLCSILESRIDSIIFRSCLVTSFQEARQLINHRYVIVNNSYVTSPSKRINKGDVIRLKKDPCNGKEYQKILNTRSLPSYLEIDFNNLTIVFLWDTNYKNTYYPIKLRYLKLARYYK